MIVAPEERRRLDPRESTKIALALLSQGTCQFEGCGAPLIVDGAIVGQIAHIHSPAPDGPRYDPALDPEAARSLPNLIYLCGAHHPLVDKNESAWTADALREMKTAHEAGQFLVTAEVLRQYVQALERPSPPNWKDRPGAPRFEIHPATNKPDGAWKFEIEWWQVRGSEIGQPTYRVLLGGEWSPLKEPRLRGEHWRLDDLVFNPTGQPFELEFHFWWDGAERVIRYHWDSESLFQTTDSIPIYE